MDEIQTLLSLFIFAFVLFLYLHITHQWKKSEDMEVYEADFAGHAQLQEICEVRQPVLFRMDVASHFLTQIQKSFLKKYDHLDVKVKDVYEYWNPSTATVDAVVLPLSSATQLTENDSRRRYLSENNHEFIEESGLGKAYTLMDDYLRPHFNANTKYDLIFGSKNACSPIRYHTNSRYFLAVASGRIHVKMAPWKSGRYLSPHKDYETCEFYSKTNVWEPGAKHLGDTDRVRYLDFDVYPGYVLYIPPYWWWSICISSDTGTVAAGFTYNTVINGLANSYDWGIHYLQVNGFYAKGAKTVTAVTGIDSERATHDDSPVSASQEPETNELGQREGIPLPPTEKAPIVTNAGVYSP